LHRLVHVREPLFLLRVRDERHANDQRDEIVSGNSLHSEFSWVGWMDTAIRASGAALGLGIRSLLFALPAVFHAPKSADDADEGAAIVARIPL
jgi:hypothetical protein